MREPLQAYPLDGLFDILLWDSRLLGPLEDLGKLVVLARVCTSLRDGRSDFL